MPGRLAGTSGHHPGKTGGERDSEPGQTRDARAAPRAAPAAWRGRQITLVADGAALAEDSMAHPD